MKNLKIKDKLDKLLILEDGTILKGNAFGSDSEAIGEIVFNTGMTGYQESITDPSYSGQILLFTYPLIGNYGINDDDLESKNPSIRGIIVKESCQKPSNFRSKKTLDQYLKENNIPGIWGIDTRSLTKKLRVSGVMRGKICNIDCNPKEVISEIKKEEPRPIEKLPKNSIKLGNRGQKYRVGVIDLGIKMGIIKHLNERECKVKLIPFNAKAEDVLSLNLDGIVISNGPGDPENLRETTSLVRDLLDKLPILGICMGHQIIGLACNARTYKLKFGHRGSNHPVKNLINNKIEITSQNHGYSIDLESLKNTDLEATHLNINDNTCEGVRHKKLPVFSVQFHPESSPGPQDSTYIFDLFINLLREKRNAKKKGY